ncbi:hypothetical protein [Pelomonas cellulosilytica]|uniref:Uncharacterized protein n=1 Tax=Pelomonas cellulosilytica TaxID=2906762 RepID=A0ABS8XV58_9BURK|nr:hypothetical protein [Pelomonas sp. P8]MCE4554701.1 hypothetical protein [Pelomonas sp. P8]
MSKPTHPPHAFWRAWLLLSACIFLRILLCLCLGWALFACLLPVLAPPPPALSSRNNLDLATLRQDK